MSIVRLNHAVLFVRDADAAADFYRRAFGFEELERPQGMRAAFMRAPDAGNHTTISASSRSGHRPASRHAARSGSITWRGRSTPSRRWPRWQAASASSAP